RLWELGSGPVSGPPLAHRGPVTAAAFSPDGKVVVTGCGVSSSREVGKGAARKWVVTLGPVVENREARLWDTATGKPIGSPLAHQDGVNAVAFRPDGKAVLTG